MILLLIIVTFLLIQGVFNYLVREYTLSSVNEQLQSALRVDPARPFSRLPRGSAGSAQVIVVTAEYVLLLPDFGFGLTYLQDAQEINALVTQLARENVDLRSNKIMNIKAEGRDYYFVSLNQPGSDFFFIYYFDMTAISAFASRINTTLLWVMVIVGLLAIGVAFILSGFIARPVRELTRFAQRLGQGNFATSSMDYKDAELAALAASMNKAAVQLDQYDKEQKVFFQNVSHELRTPLQVIRNHAEGIQHGILNTDKSSSVIIHESDRLGDMVEDLLYLSRIDAMSPGRRFELADLREILSNSAERQGSLAAQKGIDYIFDFDLGPVEFFCDEPGMVRAFDNLIANALRYAKSQIILVCKKVEDRIEVAVADDGQGFSSEDLPHVFQRFYKGKGGDHGIGLAIVQAVVAQHGGVVDAHNDGGAIITMSFPQGERDGTA